MTYHVDCRLADTTLSIWETLLCKNRVASTYYAKTANFQPRELYLFNATSFLSQ